MNKLFARLGMIKVNEKELATQVFSQFPLLWLAACFVAGILIAHFLVFSATFALIIVIIAAVFAGLFLINQKFKNASNLLLVAFVLLGASLSKIEQQPINSNRICEIYDSGQINFATPIELTGTLQKEPEETPSGFFLELKTERINFGQADRGASGNLTLFLSLNDELARQDYEQLQLWRGARIRVAARITREDKFRNFGQAVFRDRLKNKNLDAVGTIKSPLLIERLNDETTFLPLVWLSDWRAMLINQFHQHFDVSTAGVLAASLLNNRHFLDKQTSARFREGGTFHILVISGAHISFIGLLVAWLVRKISKNVFAQFIATNCLLWAFTIAVGAEVSVTRATIMFTVFQAAALFYRDSASLNSLGAAALMQLVWRPSTIFDQSFQLTFVSVAAIVGFAFPLLTKMREIGAWQLSEKTPTPPNCHSWLKVFCETLFWSERDWQFSQQQSIWKANLFKSKLPKKLEKLHLQKLWRIVFSAVFVSACVMLWLLPLQIVYFHRLSPIALILNVFVGLIIAVESFVALLALLIASVNASLAQPFVAWTEILNLLLVYSAEPFINSNLAAVYIPIYSDWKSAVYWLYYLPLIFFAVSAVKWNPFQLSTSNYQSSSNRFLKNILITVYCSLLTVIVLHPLSADATHNRLRVDFLDVGQGDSALVTTPNGTKILIDAGGRPSFKTKIVREDGETETFEPDSRSIGEAVVCEYLWNRGFDTIDYLIPSHADADHINGLSDVAERFTVKTALVARTPRNNLEFQRFNQTLENHRVPIFKIARGDVLTVDNVQIEVIWPEFDANVNAPSDNNHSIVFRLKYGAHKFLFTGDIEAATEKALLQQPENLSCDVIKVAHHGSKTSSTENFVQNTKAKFAVVSVGRDSPFGHPNPQVLERWEKAGAKVLITGENGTISFITDGKDLQINTFIE